MHKVYDHVLQAVGDTPCVRLHRVVDGVPGTLYAKLEFLNPGGSAKDRVAVRLIEQAEARGDLRPGGTVVEATTGDLGASLAMAAAVRGYACVLVVPDQQPAEKLDTLRALGAEVVVTPSHLPPDDPRSHHAVARRLAAERPGAWFAGQHENPANAAAHEDGTGREIWEQFEGRVDVVFAGLGTGGTATGIARFLAARGASARVVGVEPVGSVIFDAVKGGRSTTPFAWANEGLGETFVPAVLDPSLLHDVVRVGDRDAFHVTRRLAREEGLFVGPASGAVVAGAVHWLRQHGGKDTVAVAVLGDGGARHLSRVHSDAWMAERGGVEPGVRLGTVRDVLAGVGAPPPVTVTADVSVTEAIGLMRLHGISQLPVLRDGRIVGVLHEGRLLDEALRSGAPSRRTAGEYADDSYCTVDLDTDVAVVSDLLRRVRIALVLDARSELVAVLSRIDVIDHLARSASGVVG